ncbi:MAG TPA: HD domain-containing phosphohydrolase, partial [Phycisphaerae bacterium]|nr:HD domain-containing phosphohydrolase [Phycisphaerae bacterium]
PDRKAGQEIPLVARVLTVADALDALTSHRPFRSEMDLDAARDRIHQLAGQQFDPDVAQALLDLPLEMLDEIRESFR